MLALVVKPSLHGKPKLAKLLSELADLEPVVLGGSSVEGLKLEIQEHHLRDPNLTVVACGGDGTFHLALNAIPSLTIPLAIVPMGTGNDLARYLDLDKPSKAVSRLRDSASQGLTPVQMDMGTIELSDGSIFRFAGIASCGFDAQVNERANTYRGPAGTLKYLAALAVELVNLRARQLEVTCDDDSPMTDEFTLIAVGNTSAYGGGFKMCPTANAYDQKFEVTLVDKVSRRLLVRVLPKVFWGGHTKHRQVTQKVAQRVQISGDRFPIYADGEKIGHGPALITIHPGAMRVWQAQPSDTP
jgi:diacylglycerol kinase (ATP)